MQPITTGGDQGTQPLGKLHRVEAVRASEQASALAEERVWARAQIQAKALPFKMLRPEVERWKMQYEEVEERYAA